MRTITCLKWGGKYSAIYVNKLFRACERNMSEDFEFVCFTDDPLGVECRTEAAPDLPEWWGKVWLFSLGQPMLFFDLDCVIVGPIDGLFRDRFTIVYDPYQPSDGVRWNSSAMYLTGKERSVWDSFSVEEIPNYPGGDQDWIRDRLGKCEFFPEGDCVSYKAHVQPNGLKEENKVVYFHGYPKPHETNDDWVIRHW